MSHLNPRQIWLINRAIECIAAIEPYREQLVWEKYMENLKFLAEELLYATTEWEKYYKESEHKQ